MQVTIIIGAGRIDLAQVAIRCGTGWWDFGAGVILEGEPAPIEGVEWRFAAQVGLFFGDLRQKGLLPVPEYVVFSF